MSREHSLKSVGDEELLNRLSDLLVQSRRIESELIAHIGEVDERKLYACPACSSMFSFCVEVLNLSEAEAYLRIAVARASRKHPVLFEMLADGRLHLSGIALLAAHLTESNRHAVLARAAHRSKRQIEELVAELAPEARCPVDDSESAPVILPIPRFRRALRQVACFSLRSGAIALTARIRL
ncbi:MAG TPA: hypothetical protein VLK65_19790 [Vicinamibacteria bacterium]|nr:hypothetical protein [Vicinamibacteria bacterium]